MVDWKIGMTNLWDMVDWNGKNVKNNKKHIDELEISNYFTGAFQSPQTKTHPRIEGTLSDVDSYEFYVPILDNPPTMMELEMAIKEIGNGVSFDGIPSKIAKIIPYAVKEIILELIKKVFYTEYPNDWTMQILHAIEKSGHTTKNPKLRGIAIAPLLCRLYDIIIGERFCAWYKPNYEQAGFRPRQGCLL